ncbi:anti-sigma-D factor RsdA [Catelliglobosispora koreensis]|uniref:anti-sigma-D factor RsdA n=1 Tax=Catelliglobosispora koreensis TaxID=129052 RepID=UPI00037EA403|nr:anti-sigma-D factor RsdA [Catelliglobosispora koreensis]
MTVEHDDELLSALGSGSPVDSDDPLTGLLHAWRTEVDTDIPPLRLPSPSPAGSLAGGHVPAQSGLALDGFGAGSTAGDGRPGGGNRRKWLGGWRLPRPVIIGAIASAFVFGGLTAAAASAEPGSPFWPITQIVFSDKANSKLAEQEVLALLEQVRKASPQERPALVATAREKIARISDLTVRERLLAELEALIAAAPAPANSVLPVPSPTPSQVDGPGATPSPNTPTPSKTGGLLPPILPSLLPSLPLPLPDLPLLD